MLQHLIPSFLSIICQEVAYERLKTKDKFNLFALKVVVVPNVRWSFTKDSKCNDLTRKRFSFGKLVAKAVIAYFTTSDSNCIYAIYKNAKC